MATCIAGVLHCLRQATNVWRAPDRSPDGREEVEFIRGSVVLMRKNVLDFTDFTAAVLDGVYELLGNTISFQLVSATVGDPNTGNRGKVGAQAYLEEHVTTLTSLTAGQSKFTINFDWDDTLGIPGAVIVKNNHHSEFYLKSLTLENVPGKGRIHFVCNSWVYPASHYDYDRIFFANDAYLPGSTPGPLKKYREEELKNLRGDEVNRMLEKHDRIYGYACYNDLGDPDKGEALVRPILGGSKEYPYPRRGRTGRRPSEKDPNCESRLPLLNLNIYVPRDELFGHLKMSDFLAYALKALEESLIPLLNGLFDKTPLEFDSLNDVLKLYEGGVVLPKLSLLEEIKERIPFEMIKVLVRKDGAHALRLPLPRVIQVDKSAWRTDEEFAREMLAGANPVVIRRLQEFPPVSKLDPRTYGNNNSSITAAHLEKSLAGLTIEQALKDNKLFILDHHDALIPYLNRINNTTSSKIYASRTLLFLKEDGTLKPLAIELSLPHPDGEQQGCISRVFTPAEQGVEGAIWQLAKAYVAVNDSGVHQLISHWLHTHAVIEPFVIATHRQLSVMHPIYKLLEPHYRDTMNINALARQTLINANGILESTVFPGKYALEMSSKVYKSWNFTEQALPADLLKRGVAVKDPSSPTKLRLLIPDYPYAVDGLAIWSAIESWVSDYCTIYYKSDAAVQADIELQAWWKEVREEGHGDLKDEPWWPAMRSVAELVRACAIIVWVASALHAAVNFGQYAYAGYVANRPTISRRFMPEPGTKEYEELATNPEKVFLKTITNQLQTILGVSLIEVLSRHSSDEVYLGQRETPEWTSNGKALEAFRRFGERLVKIEESIMERNADKSLKNRSGPIEMPYVLLHRKPLEEAGGLGGGGVPNSISI